MASKRQVTEEQACTWPKNRVRKVVNMNVDDLIANDENFRLHSAKQVDAFNSVVNNVGFAGVLLAYERDDGKLVLLDGHLRKASLPSGFVAPVAVLDVTETEARLILASYDRIGSMASEDEEKLSELLENIKGSVSSCSHILGGIFSELKFNSDDEEAGATLQASDTEETIASLLRSQYSLEENLNSSEMLILNVRSCIAEKVREFATGLGCQVSSSGDSVSVLNTNIASIGNLSEEEAMVVAIFVCWMRTKGVVFIPLTFTKKTANAFIGMLAKRVHSSATAIKKHGICGIVANIIYESVAARGV